MKTEFYKLGHFTEVDATLSFLADGVGARRMSTTSGAIDGPLMVYHKHKLRGSV